MTGRTRIAVLVALFLASVSAPAQDAAGNADFLFQGRAVDPSGNGIANATVHLVAGVGDTRMKWLGELNPIRGQAMAQSNTDGDFIVKFAGSDRKFIVDGPMSLVVSAPGYQRQVQSLERSRVHCDAPFVVTLAPEEDVLVTLTTAEGQALSDAKVYPASYHSMLFPLCVRTSAERTNEEGEAKLSGTHPDALTFVFAEHPAIGKQRIAVSGTVNGRFTAQASPTRKVVGRIRTADKAQIPGLDQIKLLVFSCDAYSFQYPDTPTYCGWDFASVEADGSFEIPQLSSGHLTYRISCPTNFAWRDKNAYRYSRLGFGDDAPYQWELEFQEEPRVSVTILEVDSDRPLPNIHISTYDGRLENTATDESGKASFYRAGGRSSYMPVDSVGDFFSRHRFYQNGQSSPVDNVVEFPPYRLLRNAQWKGRVVDGEGQPYPGARVTYEYSSGSNSLAPSVYSNSDGSFSLQGVLDGQAIKLQARTDLLASQKHNVLLPKSSGLQLILKKWPLAQPIGRIVDIDGNSVVNVAVAIKRLSVFREEKYGPEYVVEEELYKSPTTVRTGQDGRFAFPHTKDFKQRLKIEISDPHYFSFRSPAIDGRQLTTFSATESGVEQINLGQFRVMRRPKAREVAVRVRSISGEAIPNGNVVLVGARTGKATGTTDSNGETTILLSDGSCIVAVWAEGHLIRFESLKLTLDSNEPTIFLTPSSGKREPQDGALGAADSKAAAQRLFADMGEPDFDNTTFHRVGLYMTAFASIDPQEFALWALRHGGKSEVGQNLFRSAQVVIRRKPELLEIAAASRLVPEQHLGGMYITAANATDNDEQRMDWLGEAMVVAKDRHLRARVVGALLAAEEFDLAVESAQELWGSLTSLQELVEMEKREQNIGDARSVGPVIAIFDLETANRLIELIASEDEIEQLKTQAILNWGLVHRDELLEKLNGKLNNDGVETWMRSMRSFDRLGYEGLPDADKLATMIDKPSQRLQFLLLHARLTSNLLLRERLVNQAIDAINESHVEIGIGVGYLEPLIEEELFLATLPPALKDELVFAALMNLPRKMEAERVHQSLAGAARIVALRAPKLGRTLLQPAFQDRGWMFGRSNFDRLAATNAVARIDPKWAIELADELCEAEYKHDVVDQLEMRSGMIQQLMK